MDQAGAGSYAVEVFGLGDELGVLLELLVGRSAALHHPLGGEEAITGFLGTSRLAQPRRRLRSAQRADGHGGRLLRLRRVRQESLVTADKGTRTHEESGTSLRSRVTFFIAVMTRIRFQPA